jgi:hypothetical protein
MPRPPSKPNALSADDPLCVQCRSIRHIENLQVDVQYLNRAMVQHDARIGAQEESSRSIHAKLDIICAQLERKEQRDQEIAKELAKARENDVAQLKHLESMLALLRDGRK